MLMQPNFFYSQPSTLPKEVLAEFCLSTTFGLSFIISSVAPTQSSTSYVYLITKIMDRNLKEVPLYALITWNTFQFKQKRIWL